MVPPLESLDEQEEYARTIQSYEEYLDHNELELALDMLEEVSEIVFCGSLFWEHLAQAAEQMRLVERARVFRQQSAHAKQREGRHVIIRSKVQRQRNA